MFLNGNINGLPGLKFIECSIYQETGGRLEHRFSVVG